MKAVKTFWFTSNIDSFGIVLTVNEMGVKTARIGKCLNDSEETDTARILDWGVKIPLETINEIREHICPKKPK